MSYTTINKCANDPEFQGRLQACAAQEGAESPLMAMSSLMWPVSCATDIEAAYESAVLAGNEHPGSDPSVITDQMILSAVQANLPAPT
jgi:hypothetical protein